MSNYKGDLRLEMSFYGPIPRIPLDAKPKVLYFNMAGATTPKSMHDFENNANYVPPTGYDFIITSIYNNYLNPAGQTVTIDQSGTVDTSGTEKLSYIAAGNLSNQLWYIPFTLKIVVAKFVTVECTSGALLGITICGYEIKR